MPSTVASRWILAGLAALSISVSIASAATVTRTPTVGPPTTVVTLSGTGFVANDFVDIYWDSAWLQFVATDGSGAFSAVQITVPGSAAPGSHTITARNSGAPGGGTSTFTVRASWPLYKVQTTGRGVNLTENQLVAASLHRLEDGYRFPVPGGAENVNAAPVVSGGVLYFRSKTRLLAYTLSTRALKFNVGVAPMNDLSSSAPAISGSLVFVSGDNALRAYSITNGALVWRATLGSTTRASTPVVAGGVVYVVGLGGTTGNGLYVFSTSCGTAGATCTPLWFGQSITTSATYAEVTTPVLGGGHVFIRQLDSLLMFPSTCPTAACASQAGWGVGVESNPSMIYAGGLLYVASNTRLSAFRIDPPGFPEAWRRRGCDVQQHDPGRWPPPRRPGPGHRRLLPVWLRRVHVCSARGGAGRHHGLHHHRDGGGRAPGLGALRPGPGGLGPAVPLVRPEVARLPCPR